MDKNSRTNDIKVEYSDTDEMLSLKYEYDRSGNVEERTDRIRENTNTYEYDDLNRLEGAEIHGSFYREEENNYGYVTEDYNDQENLQLVGENKEITLDYAAGSVGINFAGTVEDISRIQLITGGISDHRVVKRALTLYYRDDGDNYKKISDSEWEAYRDNRGNFQIEITESIDAQSIKVHCKFDDWLAELTEDGEFARTNKGEFTNILGEMINVFSRQEKVDIGYEYDEAGNRKKKTFVDETVDYKYYTDTNQLKTDGEYAYIYDEAGNLIKKGNKYNIEGDTVEFTATEGEGVEYYEYSYNLQGKAGGS